MRPFAALYVLILASASPLLAKESGRIRGLFAKLSGRRGKKGEAEDEQTEDEQTHEA